MLFIIIYICCGGIFGVILINIIPKIFNFFESKATSPQKNLKTTIDDKVQPQSDKKQTNSSVMEEEDKNESEKAQNSPKPAKKLDRSKFFYILNLLSESKSAEFNSYFNTLSEHEKKVFLRYYNNNIKIKKSSDSSKLKKVSKKKTFLDSWQYLYGGFVFLLELLLIGAAIYIIYTLLSDTQKSHTHKPSHNT
jgi:hypothetical protein